MECVKQIKGYKMKFLLIVLCVAVIVGCSDNRRGLVFQNTIINFGQAKVDDGISATFVFKNESDETVLIYDVTYDCNCISLNEKTFPYAVSPHAIDSLTVQIDGTKEGVGFKSRNIALRTDSEPKIQVLKIEGDIL